MNNNAVVINEDYSDTSLILEHIRGKLNKKANIFLYQIDALFIQEKDHQCVINGWGISSNSKEPLQLCFLNRQVKKVYFRPVDRPDIEKKLNLEKGSAVGFQVVLKYKPNVKINQLWCLLKTQDEISYPVRIYSQKQYLSEINRNFKLIKKENSLTEALSATRLSLQLKNPDRYVSWIHTHEDYDLAAVFEEIAAFKLQPVISIVVPVYNVEEKWLRGFIESVLGQYYPNWELCLADDHSPAPHIKPVIDAYVAKDQRIKVVYRKENGHISEATNTAIKMATGDFIAFMDNDDELPPFALYENVKAINKNPQADFLYSDEDKMDIYGHRFDAFFKPDWNPKLLLAHNYITHFVVVKKCLQEQAGLLRSAMNGAQDYDFVLRATEKARCIVHIPRILYHWRTIEGSTASNPEAKMYAYLAGEKALDEALQRRNLSGKVELAPHYGMYDIHYEIKQEKKVCVVLCQDKRSEPLLDQAIKTLCLQTQGARLQFLLPGKYKNITGAEIKIDRMDSDSFEPSAVNQAIEHVDPDCLIWFWDGETLPEKETWVDAYCNELVDPQVAIAGSKIKKKDVVLSAGMSTVPDKKLVFDVHNGYQCEELGYYFRLILSQNVFAVRLNGLMMRVSDWKQWGGFDENLNGCELSIDLCMRCRKEGKAVVWTPHAVFESTVSAKYGRRRLSNRIFLKYEESKWNDPYYNPNLIHFLEIK